MSSLLLATLSQAVFKVLLFLTALFLILLVLVQRGRGGGLAGALGGMGGSSAFGAKAGDVFTKITAYTALFWILLCIAATKMSPSGGSRLDTDVSRPGTSQLVPGVDAEDSASPDAETTDALGVTDSAESSSESDLGTDSADQGQAP